MKTSTLSVHTSLLSAMLGASIALAIQTGTVKSSVWVLVAILALLLHAANFYHGKLMAFDELHAVAAEARPIVRSTLLLANTTLFMLFCVIAAKITNASYLAGGEIAVRAFDGLLVTSDLRLGDRTLGARSISSALRRQLHYWLIIDTVAIILLDAALYEARHDTAGTRYHIVVIVFAALILIDLVVEYGGFRANYFQHRADSWNVVAERWDRLQGEYGDDYRHAVLHPHVIAWIRNLGLGCCVDLGCGNGCTARVIADATGVAVLGVDAAPTMIDFATLYESRAAQAVDAGSPRPVSFLNAAIDDRPPPGVGTTASICRAAGLLRDETSAPLGVLSMFLPQDCARLDVLMACASALLHDGEPFMMVYESASGFDPSAPHATTARAWKYSLRRSGPATQVMTWLPVRETATSSLFNGQPDDAAPPINTYTHYRMLDHYSAAAAVCGLALADNGDVMLAGPATTPGHLNYQRRPKFSYITFIKDASC